MTKTRTIKQSHREGSVPRTAVKASVMAVKNKGGGASIYRTRPIRWLTRQVAHLDSWLWVKTWGSHAD